MIEIFSPDTLRKSVETASGGNATVLYDAYGNPNFMSVIPRKTLGDLYPTDWLEIHGGVATDTHPAFIIQDTTGGLTTEVSQIFISQYANTIQNNCGISMPNQIPYHGDRTDFDAYANNKGYGWHTMNSLEYGLLWGLAMAEDVNVKGNTSGVYSDTTEQFNFSQDEAAKSNLFEIETDTLTCVTGMTNGEIVSFEDTNGDNVGQGILVNTYKTRGEYTNNSTDTYTDKYIIVVQVDVGHQLNKATDFTGVTSAETGSILQVIMHETLGAGPSSWTHDHSPWGVWMLGAGREFIDSCMLTTVPSFSDLVLKCVRNNYREQGDRDLEVLTTNINAHVLNRAGIGYQYVGPAGIPDEHLNNDVGLITGADPYYWGYEETAIWALLSGSSNCDDEDMLLLQEMGLYPVCSNSVAYPYRAEWLSKENIRWTDGYFVTMYREDPGPGRMYLYRGGCKPSFTQERDIEQGMHAFGFTANAGVNDRKALRFRTVYIPEI